MKLGAFLLIVGATMARRILVSFSNSDEILKTSIDVSVCNSHSKLLDELEPKIGSRDFAIEIYNDAAGGFVSFDGVWGSSVPRLLLTKEEPIGVRDDVKLLCGRKFQISEGITIGPERKILRIKEKDEASLGTGLVTWDGSVVLAKYLERESGLVMNKTVLELGAGTGLAGLAASFLGASKVVLSDLPYAMPNLLENIQNHVEESQDVTASVLDWTDSSTYQWPSGSNHHWGVILCADIVWLEDLVPPLVSTLQALSDQETVVLISHQKRSERTDKLFFESLSSSFEISMISDKSLSPLFTTDKIQVFRLRKQR